MQDNKYIGVQGQAISKSEYAELYLAIGDLYSNDETAEGFFNVPDLRDKFAQGANGNLGEVIEAGLPNITGSFGNWNQWTGSRYGDGAFSARSDGKSAGFRASGDDDRTGVTFNASRGETKTDGTLKTSDEHHVYGASDTVQPPAVALYYIIKATDYSQVTEDVLDDSKATTGNVWSAAKVKEEIDNKNNYSTEETVIGKWIDGKPIYRKVFTGLLLNARDKWVSLKPIDNEDIIISATWYTSTSIDGRSHTFGYLLTTFYNNNLDITVRGNMTESEKIDTVIIEYTKTTD